ncbi:MAG TPA: urease subunit beta [Nitrospiraceae bacterium]|nr:urease subunit beta [Nitrospiraceae bacterium]
MAAKSTRAPSKTSKPANAPRKTGSLAATIRAELAKPVVPGEIIFAAGDIEAFKGRHTKEVTVTNHGDRPIQVGSHCHFFETNHALSFDRGQAFGFKLCIPAGTAVRFEPGEEKRVTLVALAGKRVVHGINGLTDGSLDDLQIKTKALARAAERGFIGKGEGR